MQKNCVINQVKGNQNFNTIKIKISVVNNKDWFACVFFAETWKIFDEVYITKYFAIFFSKVDQTYATIKIELFLIFLKKIVFVHLFFIGKA